MGHKRKSIGRRPRNEEGKGRAPKMMNRGSSPSRDADGVESKFRPTVHCSGIRNALANLDAIERNLFASELETNETTSREAIRPKSGQPVPSPPRPRRRAVLKALGAMALLAEQGCRTFIQPTSEVALVLMDQAWLNKAFQAGRQHELDQFTK